MATFGENLRREREMRGVSLEEICEATKISLRNLQALEAGQFEKLPGGIFTRSFVRTYAKYLGLDEESVMAEFQLAAPAADQQTNLGRMSVQRPAQPKEGSRAGVLGLLAALAVLAAGFAYYHFVRRAPKAPPASVGVEQYSSSPTPSVPNAQQAQAPANSVAAGGPTAGAPAGAPETAPEKAPNASASPSQPAVAGAPPNPSATASGGLVLQVAATEKSWVAIEGDGKPVVEQTMEPNQIQTFRANTSFDVLTGNAEGIILTLNGKTLDPLGHRGETKKVHLTLSDVQNGNP